VRSQPLRRTCGWALLLLAFLLVAGGAAPAQAQAQNPPADWLDLNPVLQLVCDLIGLLCPPAPSPPAPAQPPAEPPAEAVPGPFSEIQPIGSNPSDAMLRPTTPKSVVPPLPPGSTSETLPSAPGDQPPALSEPAPGESGESGGTSGSGFGPASRPALMLPRPEEVDLSPGTVAVAAGVSIFGLILIGFPAELFNKTLRENYPRIRKMFPRMGAKQSPADVSRQVLALVVSSTLAGFLAAIQKINSDWTLRSVLTVALAIGLGFLLTTAVYEIAGAVATDRLGMPRRVFRTYAAGLPVVAFFVAVSTIGQLQPAYLYGHLAGSRLEGKHDTGTRGPAIQTVVSCSALLVFGLLCWALRAVVTTSPWTDILAGVTVVALNRLAFSLIPVTFLDGNTVFRFSRGLWAGVYSVAVLAFLLLVILPAARNAPPSAIGSAVMPFVIFVALSLAVWAFFRHSHKSATQPA
jgi:hypothetical protein